MLHPVFRAALCLIAVIALSGCRLKEESCPDGGLPAPPDVAAPPADAIETPSGLASKVLHIGFSNVRPTAQSIVEVNYTGWSTNGCMFDSSIARGKPYRTGLSRVIPGWTEGVQLMVVGEKRRFWIPPALAYKTMPDRPQGILVFDIELLGVQ